MSILFNIQNNSHKTLKVNSEVVRSVWKYCFCRFIPYRLIN